MGRHRHDEVAGQQNSHAVGDMHAFERSIYDRRSGRADQEMARRIMLASGRRASDSAVQPPVRKNCRIEGDYEVEVSALLLPESLKFYVHGYWCCNEALQSCNWM